MDRYQPGPNRPRAARRHAPKTRWQTLAKVLSDLLPGVLPDMLSRMTAIPAVLGIALAVFAPGCSDMGKPPDSPQDTGPRVLALRPARTFPGDTLVVIGTGFGAERNASAVLFDGPGGPVEAAVTGWSDTSIRVLVPAGAQPGGVRIREGGVETNAIAFEIAPDRRTWSADILPIVSARCLGCHASGAPSGGLDLGTLEGVLRGGGHGPAVLPRRSGESLLWRKLALDTPPIGERMPRGGPYLGADQILTVADWIDQGAREGAPPGPLPTISELVPARTVAGDTVRVAGTAFGSAQGRVVFTADLAGPVDAAVLSWAETMVTVLVPAGSGSGFVHLVAGGRDSDPQAFGWAPRLVSYQTDLRQALFESHLGCASCHGGTENLYLDSYAGLMSGSSTHGPVVVPRRSGASLLWRKVALDDPGVGSRMPLGGVVTVPDSLIGYVADWIDQGARDN